MQGSSSTTAAQIDSLFVKAQTLQRENPKVQYLVCFDEAGLPQDEMRVMKALHEWLDEGEIGFVCLSNRAFDCANQNRMLSARREVEGDDDLRNLTIGCLGGSTENPISGIDSEITAFQKTYRAIEADSELKRRYHNRDYIHFARYLGIVCEPAKLRGQKSITRQAVLESLQYNYSASTLEEFMEVCSLYFQNLRETTGDVQQWADPRPEEFLSVDKALQRSLQRPIPEHIHLRPRFKILIDPLDDYSLSERMVGQIEEWNRAEAVASGTEPQQLVKMFLSNFPEDATAAADAQVVGRLRHYMEVGAHVIIHNGDRVLGHLFDVLNQNYTVVSVPPEGGGEPVTKYYAKVVPDHVCAAEARVRQDCGAGVAVPVPTREVLLVPPESFGRGS